MDKTSGKEFGTNHKALCQAMTRATPTYFDRDPSKAESLLGWKRKVSFQELVRRMVGYDIELFKKNTLIRDAGYEVCYPLEED